jgi:tetratricopeptide (TPR) repeat protein
MILWGLILLLSSTVWAQRPEGVLEGPPWAKTAQVAIENERFDEALVSLQAELKGAADSVWKNYLLGLIEIEQGQLEAAESSLKTASEKTHEISDGALSNRLLSRVTRKIGLIERKRGDYDASRRLHYTALDLAQKYGSPEEEHDCLISLDVDCYYLQDWSESERVLRESFDVAAQIVDPVARTRAQATSYNNLAGTLTELHNFEEALEKAQAALMSWEEWENMTGDAKGFRAGWAHYALADVYLAWAKSLAERDPLEASNKRGMAKYELLVLTMLARDAGRPQKDFDEIDKRLKECD